MGIVLNRFNERQITPIKDVMLFEKIFPTNGIIQGCALTHLGSNQVSIAAGTGIIQGRDFTVTAETLLVQLASAGTMPGRIYIRYNLSNTVTPAQILSVCASSLPALTQDSDFNIANGIWEEELATYSATTTAISGLTTTIATITTAVGNMLATLENVLAETETGSLVDSSVIKLMSEVKTFSILTTDWTGTAGNYTATKTWTGLKTTHVVESWVESASPSDTAATATEIANEALYQWAAASATNTIKFRATAIPSDTIKARARIVGI